VVDVHFAPFFVTQMLGLQQNGLLFSVIDELQSLDRELYNSLIYVKHYHGDIKVFCINLCKLYNFMNELTCSFSLGLGAHILCGSGCAWPSENCRVDSRRANDSRDE